MGIVENKKEIFFSKGVVIFIRYIGIVKNIKENFYQNCCHHSINSIAMFLNYNLIIS
jgi:hypothetical protein